MPQYSDFNIFITVLITICGTIITITGAITGISKVKELMDKGKINKNKKIDETLNRHSTEILQLKNDIQQIKVDMQETKEINVLICKGVKCLMDNSITGNGIDNLKKTRKELDDFLIEKRV